MPDQRLDRRNFSLRNLTVPSGTLCPAQWIQGGPTLATRSMQQMWITLAIQPADLGVQTLEQRRHYVYVYMYKLKIGRQSWTTLYRRHLECYAPVSLFTVVRSGYFSFHASCTDDRRPVDETRRGKKAGGTILDATIRCSFWQDEAIRKHDVLSRSTTIRFCLELPRIFVR